MQQCRLAEEMCVVKLALPNGDGLKAGGFLLHFPC